MQKNIGNQAGLVQDIKYVRGILDKHNLSIEELKLLINRDEPLQIPISIFKSNVGPMASLCIYLKDNLHLNFSKIAKLVNRDARSIWADYSNAKKKAKPLVQDLSLTCSIDVFRNRERSIMENLVFHLRQVNNLSLNEIAHLLDRSNKTIWCFYNRALGKERK